MIIASTFFWLAITLISWYYLNRLLAKKILPEISKPINQTDENAIKMLALYVSGGLIALGWFIVLMRIPA